MLSCNNSFIAFSWDSWHKVHDAGIAFYNVTSDKSIMDLVPAVPTECDERVVTAQHQLITIAEAIESLETQIIYLQPLLDECCTSSEPDLMAILDGTTTGTTVLA
jgi:hypothetical protein